MFYADVTMGERARLPVPVEHEERAAYVVEGSVGLIPEGVTFNAGQLLIFKPGEEITLYAQAPAHARLMLLGGEPLDGSATSGGTSSQAPQSASSKRRRTGRQTGSPQCQKRGSSSRYRSRGLSLCGIRKI
jgi:hypothetical protein